MIDHIAEIRKGLESLQREAQAVSTSLREPISSLSSGIPIDAELLAQLRDVCERVVAFRQRLKAFGTENSLIPVEINLDGARFTDLDELLQQFESSSLSRLQSITSKLEMVERLIVRKQNLRPTFQVVFDEAKRLHDLLHDQSSLTLPQELLDLGTEKHRLAKLLRFLEIQQNPEEVNPDELDVVDSEVEAAFGRRFRVLAHEFLRLPPASAPAPTTTAENAELLNRESVPPPAIPSQVEPTEAAAAANRMETDASERPPQFDAVAAPPRSTAPIDAVEVAPLEEVAISETTDDVDQYAEQLVAAAVAEAQFDLPQPPEVSIWRKDAPTEVFEPVLGESSEALAEGAELLLSEIELGGVQSLDYRKVEELALQLLHAKRSGIAWVLSSGLRSEGVPFGKGLPARFLRAAAIVRLMYRPDGETAEILRTDCNDLLSGWRHEGEVPVHYYFWLLAVAAKPALYAHDSGGRDILWRIANSPAPSKAVRSLAKLFAEFASNEGPLDPVQIRSTIHIGTRDTLLSDLRQRAVALLGRSGRADRMSGSATKVWRFLTQSDGVVRRLLQPVQESQKPEAVGAVIREVRSTAAIKHEIELAEGRAGAGTIRRGSPDYEDLVKDIEAAREIAARWAALSVEPSSVGQDPVARLRVDFETARSDVIAELAAMIQTVQHPNQIAIRSACENCIETLESIAEVLRGEVEDWAPQDALARYMEADLHLIPGQDPGAWKRDCSVEDALCVLRFLKSKCLWRDCAQQLVDRDQFESLGIAIQRLRESSPTAASFIETFRTETLLSRWRNLAWRYLKTEHALNNSMTNALVGVEDAQNYRAQLDEIKAAIPGEFIASGSYPAANRLVPIPPSHLFFESAKSTIGEIDGILNKNRKHFISEAGKTVVLPNSASPRVRAAFEKLVGLGAFNQALVLSELAGTGSLRLSTQRATALDEFFPHIPDWFVNREIDSQIPEDPAQMAKLVLDLPTCGAGNKEEVEENLRHWISLAKWIESSSTNLSQRSSSWEPDILRSILEFVGFSVSPGVIPVPDLKATHRLQVDFSYTPTEDRNLCPLSEFGSQSGGKLRLILLRRKTDPLELSSLLGPLPQRTVVLYFRSYTAEERRTLARACWNSSKTFLVLDNALFAYLTTRSSSRFRAFFECTLPFTYAQPYVSSGGSLPPEMFFGRETQKAGLSALGGPYLVYGGRQLGKTALLREVERLVNREQPTQQAIWLDLQSLQLGINQPIDELWTYLYEELKNRKIVVAPPDNRDETVDQQTVLEAIRLWLADNANRRLLLLLDEADMMLEQDNRPRLATLGHTSRHVLTNGLAGLQTEFKNRFKVVFAGLRDVQHFAYDNSHPFGKLGKPLLIGPFAASGGGWSDQRKELEAARELILDPLRCLGFRFQSESALQLVLWATNFYPSLGQIVGENLIQYATQAQPNGPPYELTEATINAVLHSPRVIAEFEHRLNLTLGLDGRFAAIVYVIAALIYTAPDRHSFEGFDKSVIETEVKKHASALFGQSADDVHRVLQDMVEMGVLRRTGDRFDLRSPALLQMLGDYDAVYKQLGQERELKPVYDAAKNRSLVPRSSQANEFEYSPLTDEQFQSLIVPGSAISVCFGTVAGGLDRVADCLQAQFPNQQKRLFAFNDADLSRWKEDLTKVGDRPKGKTSIFLITSSCSWSLQWIFHAKEKIEQYRTNPVHFLFLADPKVVAKMNEEPGPIARLRSGASHYTSAPPDVLRQMNVHTFVLGPWDDVVLRTWLHELGYEASPSERKKISSALGNWPALLVQFNAHAKRTNTPWIDDLEHFRELCLASPREYLSLFGFDTLNPEQLNTLSYLSTGPASLKDLREFENSNVHDKVLGWAQSLALVNEDGGKYRLDSFVSELVSRLLAKNG